MADLMSSVKTNFPKLKKGEVVEGVITKISPTEILVDIHAKTEAVVLEKDKRNMRNLINTFKVGDTVTASVLNPESDFGYPVISLRRYVGDITWDKLVELQKSQEPLEVTVQETTKGRFLVASKTGNMNGFLPNSQLSTELRSLDQEGMNALLGTTIQVYMLELAREAGKVIFSQKKVLTAKDFEELVKTLKVGDKITSIITNVTNFGVFANLQINGERTGIDGLIHISEISWNDVPDIKSAFTQGQVVEAVIIGFDKDAKRVDLSIKRKTQDPFQKTAKEFSVDQKIKGSVSKVTQAGVVILLETPKGEKAEGLIRREKIPPGVTYEVGQSLQTTITQIDMKRRKILLSPVLTEKPIGYR